MTELNRFMEHGTQLFSPADDKSEAFGTAEWIRTDYVVEVRP